MRLRRLESFEAFRACERIQQRIWGSVSVGSELLAIAQRHGGVVLGALVEGRIAGFLCAFLAQRHGCLIHWSHVMAVEPRYRDRGLGTRMKLMHRRLALEQGIQSICWTFDPLQSRNAALSIHRLGAVVEEYVPDYYGSYGSLIERGLPTDRLVVNWRIAACQIERRLRQPVGQAELARAAAANVVRVNAQGFLQNHTVELNLDDPELLMEIPANPDRMRAEALGLARRWRLETRKIFQHYMARDYEVSDFLVFGKRSARRCAYLLARVSSHV